MFTRIFCALGEEFDPLADQKHGGGQVVVARSHTAGALIRLRVEAMVRTLLMSDAATLLGEHKADELSARFAALQGDPEITRIK